MTKAKIYIVFIGGAGDKEPFLWGNINLPFTDAWPHYTMKRVADFFKHNLYQHAMAQKQSIEWLDNYCKIDYLSYTELFFDTLKVTLPNLNESDLNGLGASLEADQRYQQLLANIDQNSQIYIIGHSLGGWNGAHLSALLSRLGYQVKCLVTLDPVGTGNHEVTLLSPLMKKAQIYRHAPEPIAATWINIQALHIEISKKQLVGNFEDWVAWAGGQWLIDHTYPNVSQQITSVTNFSHKQALELFRYPTSIGKSAHELVMQLVLEDMTRLTRPQHWLYRLGKKLALIG